MTMRDQEKIKKTLSAIFSRKGADGLYTRLFDNMDVHQKEMLLSQVQLTDGELPIIGSVESKDKWLLVTTDRVVWHLSSNIQSLPVKDIQDVVADFRTLLVTGRGKDQMRELQILTMQGGQYAIEVEEGSPLIGVWNALKNLGARNRATG